MRGLEDVRRAEFLAVLFEIAAACRLVRLRQTDFAIDDLPHQGFLIGLAAPFAVVDRMRRQFQAPRLVQQKLTDRQRSGRFSEGGGGGRGGMVLRLPRDRFAWNDGAVDADDIRFWPHASGYVRARHGAHSAGCVGMARPSLRPERTI